MKESDMDEMKGGGDGKRAGSGSKSLLGVRCGSMGFFAEVGVRGSRVSIVGGGCKGGQRAIGVGRTVVIFIQKGKGAKMIEQQRNVDLVWLDS